MALEGGHAARDVVRRGEEHVVVEREDDLTLGRAHAFVAGGRRDVLRQRHEVGVRELVADHLLRAVGGGVVDRDDLERRVALGARGLQRAAERVAALVVQDRDRDRRAHLEPTQFGTWPRIQGPTRLATGTGSRFQAAIIGAKRLASRSTGGGPPGAVSTKIHGNVWSTAPHWRLNSCVPAFL